MPYSDGTGEAGRGNGVLVTLPFWKSTPGPATPGFATH